MSTSHSIGSRVVEFFVKGLGTGWIPWAPGTWGSLLGLALAYYSRSILLTWPEQLIAAVVVALISWGLIHLHEKKTQEHDESSVVIDEIAGILFVFIGIPMTLPNIAAGFFLFRFFDILKPYPISWADRSVPGAFGTLLDDLMAGAIGCVFLQFIVYWGTW